MKLVITAYILASTMQFIGESVPDGAVQIARDYVRHEDGAALGEPYISYRTDHNIITGFEIKPANSILRFVRSRRWFFPIIKNGLVEKIICVLYSESVFKLCGTYQYKGYNSEFLEYRNKLAPGYELAEYCTSDCGDYWVVHKNEQAFKFIAIDPISYRILAGRNIDRITVGKIGRPVRVEVAVPKILEAAQNEVRQRKALIHSGGTRDSIDIR